MGTKWSEERKGWTTYFKLSSVLVDGTGQAATGINKTNPLLRPRGSFFWSKNLVLQTTCCPRKKHKSKTLLHILDDHTACFSILLSDSFIRFKLCFCVGPVGYWSFMLECKSLWMNLDIESVRFSHLGLAEWQTCTPKDISCLRRVSLFQ